MNTIIPKSDIRQDDFRRPTIHANSTAGSRIPGGVHAASAPHRKPMVAKGHDAILKGMQDRSATIRIESISGVLYQGVLVNRDRYTITIRTVTGATTAGDIVTNDITIYKQGIESFSAVSA